MVNQKLTGNFDDDDEKEQFEFEPLFLDNLLNSKIRKTYVQSMLDPDTPDFDEDSLSAELRNQNILPDSYFGTTALNNVMTEADLLLSKIRDEQLDQIAYTFNEDKMLLMKTLQGTTDKEWYIYGNRAWYNKDYASQGEIQTLELSNSQSVLSGYVTSLVLLAALPEEVRNEFPVTLHAVSQKKGVVSFNYRATPKTARITLCKIYNAMYIEGFCNSVPEKILREDYGKSKENQISFEEFMEGLSGYNGRGEWQYFSKQDLFDFNILEENNYLSFARDEASFRKDFNFPPYIKLVKLLFTAKTQKDLNTYGAAVAKALKDVYGAFITVEGPVKCGVKTKDLFQQYYLIKINDATIFKGLLNNLMNNKPPKKLQIKILADPYNFI